MLVFEDLHWADEALLSFLEHLADWSQGVPLLVLCTARPELQEQHPTWAAGLRNATTINLAPLTDEETARLIGSLLERAVLPAETQQALLERAGGNPLYAEEFVRLLADREQLDGAVEEVPDSVQALIAARLDTLSPERKSLLQDAAVIGKVFWAGALAEMGDRERARGRAGPARALAQGARPPPPAPARWRARPSTASGTCWSGTSATHRSRAPPVPPATARPRPGSSGKAGERAEDLADVLAYHYLQALELARAAGQAEEAEELEANAIRYLALAGERALALDVERAEASLAKALALAPAGHPERAVAARALGAGGAAAEPAPGDTSRARGGARPLPGAGRERRRRAGADRARGRRCGGLATRARRRRSREALALLEAQPPGPELVAAYAELAGSRFVGSAYAEAIAAAERALALAAELGLPEPAARARLRGAARAPSASARGSRTCAGRSRSRSSRARAAPQPSCTTTSRSRIWQYEGPRAALAACREGIDFCERRGIAEFALGDRQA